MFNVAPRCPQIYEQYDDEEIGALDQDEIRGFAGADSQLLNNALEEFEQQMKQVCVSSFGGNSDVFWGNFWMWSADLFSCVRLPYSVNCSDPGN